MTNHRTPTTLATLAALALALVATAFAQTAPAPAGSQPEEAVKLEAFTVTGSNIKRLDYEKVLPVTILGNPSRIRSP